MKNKKQNPNRITENTIRTAVRNKVKRMEDELKRNPTNVKTAQQLAAFKKMHKSKLD